jgi:uncharacterized membrane protein YfcA
MLISISKWTVIFFGVFLIAAGFLMLFAPVKANQLLRKAGSNNLINYTEITIRMIPAAALILAADLSRFPDAFRLFGWFMIFTSLVLYFVPRRLHHQYAVMCAEILKPNYFRLMSPLSMLFGAALIYSVI